MAFDFAEARRQPFADEPGPADWGDVRPLSWNGIGLFGVGTDGNLYWDGKLVETTKRLANFERVLAIIGAGSAAIIALIEVARLGRDLMG